MKKLSYVFLFLSLSVSVAFGAKTILCDPPQGTRVDYFSYNAMNLQNETFLMSRDRVSGMQPRIIFDESTKTISFEIGDASQMKTNPKSGNMSVLMQNENQISFAGIINDAPILGTYYPKIGILIYSQQSIWPGQKYFGARAVMFYSRCK